MAAEHRLSDLHGQANGPAAADHSFGTSPKRRRYSRSSLPTRVSSACERCRHHKSRCDPFRPCSLCVRANVDCRPIPAGQTRKDNSRNPGASKRRRRITSPAPQVTTTEETWDRADADPARETTASAPAGDSDVTVSADAQSSQSSIDCGEAESAIGIARKICELGSQHIDERTTSAIPGYRASTSTPIANSGTTGQRLPIASILGQSLPPMAVVESLLEDYFDAVHWFSLVVYEPKFRRKLHSISGGSAYPSQRPFLMLLVVMLGMATWYRSQRTGADSPDNGHDWRKWSADLMKLVELNLVELMDQPSVTAAQTFCLLGSHHVYHGRPNLSFSLLGATIKMSQALGMHREPLRASFEDIEERKRVWWTIYTWDRFASITYGRPLGINDKDCNINMPADILENPSFVGRASSDQSNAICYSPYQRELNRLYLIASPALETVFGSRTSRTSKQLVGDTYVALVKDATQNLQRWRQSLPGHLVLDLKRDFGDDGGPSSGAYALQSLSLQLTYDNILIVLHRPLLARQVDHLSSATNGPSPSGRMSETGSPMCHSTPTSSGPQSNLAQTASSELWMNAAVRTSRVTELPALAQLATDSHLVAFLAINLFNAAIVLAVMALSEPLSDTAQDVKRTITRILRLQDLLGKRSALSKQSTTVLKDVITMLLRRESAAMLAPITGTSNQQMGNGGVRQNLADPTLMSVEDTLRLPLDATSLDPVDPLAGRGSSQGWPDLSRAHRLNESLTSVQYVMAPGDDRSFNTPPVIGEDNSNTTNSQHISTEQNMQPHNVWQQVPADYEWDRASVSPRAVEDSYYRDTESGLYWLWDMTWNGAGLSNVLGPMSALIRTLLLLRDDAGVPGLAARGEVQQVGKHQPEFVAMATIGLCSWLSTFSLLCFLTYRFLFWQRYYKHPLARNQYVVLIYNLLLADLQQATAFMISYHWIDKGMVQAPSAACVLQGWWIQTADPGSGLFVLAIAAHTGAVVLRGRQLEFRNFVMCIVALWCFILLLGFIPVGLYGPRTFVISESGWCWLSVNYEAERVWVHYLWIFISEFGSIVLYGIMFFYLRYRMKQAAMLRQNRDHLTRMNRVVIYMVIYPFVYIGLSLPLAAGRMCTANNIIPSTTYFAVAGSLMALSGFVDVLVYTLTRKHLLVDTNMDAGSRSYNYYFNSNTYETHISTAAGATSTGKHGGAGGGGVKKGNRFRRGLGMNRATVDDGEGSTDEIVRKGDDWELGEMDRGVYQEVTFEITHEPAQQKEQQQKEEDEQRREQHSSASEPSHQLG